MKLGKLWSCTGLAAALLLAATIPVRANIVIVTREDSGGGTVTVTGTAPGADVTNFNTSVTEINGASVSIPLTFATLHIIDSGGVITGTGTKTIGLPGSQAVLNFSITSGLVSGSHVDLDGVITSIVGSGMATVGGTTYDFNDMVPGGLISLALTKTGTDYANVFNHPGVSAPHSGFGMQEQAVPEPATMALLGIGMTSIFAFRRFLRRTQVH